MAFDGIFVSKLLNEISEKAADTRVEKIYQPSKDELVILLRKKSFSEKLLISVRNSCTYMAFIDRPIENPPSPPMFCMLMRKNLGGAKFLSAESNAFERVAYFKFESRNELGDRIELILAAELIGNRSNIILIGEDGRIIDCIRRSDIEAGGRLVQPGAVYTPPERTPKMIITEDSAELITEKITNSTAALQNAVVETLDGFSPLAARELCFRAGLDAFAPANSLNGSDKAKFSAEISEFCNIVGGNGGEKSTPSIVFVDGSPKDFAYIPITHIDGAECRIYGSFSETVKTFFAERSDRERIRSASQNLNRTVTNLLSRSRRKLEARKADLKKSGNREKYRIYGELIKANIHLIEKGAEEAIVQNYYDPELKNVKIPLDSALSPAQNAQKYFKEYKKSCVAAQLLTGLIKTSEEEIKYIESVADELQRAASVAELEAVKEELSAAGYIKRQSKSNRKISIPSPYKFVSPDGFTVLVGRNNRQNDELTTKTAAKTDFWLHTKEIPGSHTVIICEGAVPPESTILFAAEKAAYYSKARNSSRVPVDCTMIKYVKKPSGAKAGMVIFTNNKTLFVTPRGD